MQQKFIINEEIIMNKILNDTILTDKNKKNKFFLFLMNYYLNILLM
jgi:hypothetical protein